MPIFEYFCEHCGGKFEALLKQPEEPPKCVACDSTAVKRLPALFAASSRKGSTCPRQETCPAAGAHCCSSANCCPR